ncbi:MAG: Tat protein translocase TatB subunit [bacterium]|jgi:Tat protein translocase TatB subunit
MFNIGFTELIVIGAIGLMIFGPDKLPSLARSLGKIITQFRRTTNDFKAQITKEIDDVGMEDFKSLQKFKDLQEEFKVPHTISTDQMAGYLEKAANALDKQKDSITESITASSSTTKNSSKS